MTMIFCSPYQMQQSALARPGAKYSVGLGIKQSSRVIKIRHRVSAGDGKPTDRTFATLRVSLLERLSMGERFHRAV